jgi:hexosaminidase
VIDLSIVPLPAEVKKQSGQFTITPETHIVADAANQQNAIYLRDLVAPPTGFGLPIQGSASQTNAIHLALVRDRDILGRETYRLTVSPRAITIEAAETSGAFYAIQTLRQLLPVEIERRTLVPGVAWRIPCVTIRDTPRFEWRGHMIDEGRHFHGPETIRRALDLMALQKLNVLHWHVTEDQGWRIEVKRYPRLTEVGSTRKSSSGRFSGAHDGVPHGGFYTQEQIREIVAYAAERHVTIVPEIEMPGHSLAALAAYPELGCTGGPFEVACRFGVMADIYCAGKEETFTFLQNVLDEIVPLFPSPFVHVGGDEAPKKRWKACPACQARIRREGLEDEHQLQTWFVNRMIAHLDALGKRAVGWNEILQPGLTQSAVAQYWLGKREHVLEAIRGGRDVIMSPFLHTYLDHSYSLTPLSQAYNFEPVFRGLDARDAQHVLGLEAPLWTEWVPNRARLDYQTYPRLTAFAETGWTPRERKDWADFRRRLAVFLRRLDELGVAYARGRDAQPSWFKRLFGLFTIAQPQTKIAT